MINKYILRPLPGRQFRIVNRDVNVMNNQPEQQNNEDHQQEPAQQLDPEPQQQPPQGAENPPQIPPQQDNLEDNQVQDELEMEHPAVQQPLNNPMAMSFKPVLFNGLHPETAGLWWRSFERYATLSGIQGNDRCNLLGLLLTGSAEIWFNSLQPQTRDDFAALEAAFREKYIAAAHTQLQRQMSVLSRTQRPGETVDEYITDARSKMVDYNYDATSALSQCGRADK